MPDEFEVLLPRGIQLVVSNVEKVIEDTYRIDHIHCSMQAEMPSYPSFSDFCGMYFVKRDDGSIVDTLAQPTAQTPAHAVEQNTPDCGEGKVYDAKHGCISPEELEILDEEEWE